MAAKRESRRATSLSRMQCAWVPAPTRGHERCIIIDDLPRARRPPVGVARPVRKPRPGAGRDRRRARHRRRRYRAQGVGRDLHRRRHRGRAGAPLCVARRGQARGGAGSFSSRRRRPRLPRRRRVHRRLYRSAGAARRQSASTRSMSAAASCIRGCAARDEIVSLEQTDIRTLDPARLERAAGFRRRRCELHLAQTGAAGDRQAAAAARVPRRADQAAIRSRRDPTIKKGIVRDPAIHQAVCDDIAAFLASQGWRVGGRMPSPILGGDGNREFFIEAERG